MDEVQKDEADSQNAERGLVDAAIAGEVQAFAALYDRYLGRVYRYVYYLVGTRPDAEDLTQEVFLRAWRAIARYQHTKASFVAWLLTIAHNAAISFFRRTKETTHLDWDIASAEPGVNPEAEALASYDRESVRQAVKRLKPEQQQVIVMRFVEDLEYADIAAALGKSEGNLRVIQHRALTELRRLLPREVDSR
ncbi:MAG: sigma-70 family RNA polymerase sigma factor [Chloroflexi bacterium]|nr:sigma-70 family RNA polymerase sigma factor [Chloroflexota bacterium]